MLKKINKSLMNIGRLHSIEFVVIHNDAGYMKPSQYLSWLEKRNKALGIAHYYINKDEIVRVVDTYNIAYHTGEWWSNTHSIGYEICQSMVVSDQDFLLNEDITLMQVAENMLFYGLDVNENTVRLHHEFVPTSCPHRSMKLHGGTTASVKRYFIERIQYFMTLGKDVDTMYAKYKRKEMPNASALKKGINIEEVAQDVIRGLYGNGKTRYENLQKAGYKYEDVQRKVNEILRERYRN
ncbi:MAG: N-acetylmuramoyl-L-alanine amidase [Gemella sp.]|nr:N-acetylmuramoyl-L-alanine amidase [Gemella sp.]